MVPQSRCRRRNPLIRSCVDYRPPVVRAGLAPATQPIPQSALIPFSLKGRRGPRGWCLSVKSTASSTQLHKNKPSRVRGLSRLRPTIHDTQFGALQHRLILCPSRRHSEIMTSGWRTGGRVVRGSLRIMRRRVGDPRGLTLPRGETATAGRSLLWRCNWCGSSHRLRNNCPAWQSRAKHQTMCSKPDRVGEAPSLNQCGTTPLRRRSLATPLPAADRFFESVGQAR